MSYEERYEKLIQSVMAEFDCDRIEAEVFIETSGMFYTIEN